MKNESLSIIRDIIAGYNQGVEIDLARAQELLKGVIRIETPATSNKFDIWKWTANDKMRPQMNGIFHQNGFKVASDTHVLCKVQEEYPTEYEGCLITKNGALHHALKGDRDLPDFIGFYPNFESVIPADDVTFAVKVDLSDFKDFLKTVKAEASANKKSGVDVVSFVKVSYDARTVHHITWTGKQDEEVACTYFRLDTFTKLASFMETYGLDEIRFSKERPNSCAAKVSDGKNTAIIMPCMAPETEDEYRKVLTFEA